MTTPDWKAPTPWPVAGNMSQPIVAAVVASPWDALTQDQCLMKWQELKDGLARAKEAEMEMRKYIVSRAFPQAEENTNTIELGGGYELKAGIKYNYNLDSDLSKVAACLVEIEKMGNEGAFLAERLVKWSATFLLTEYRKLQEVDATDIQKKILAKINTVLTITDAAPTLEIKEPKKAKK